MSYIRTLDAHLTQLKTKCCQNGTLAAQRLESTSPRPKQIQCVLQFVRANEDSLRFPTRCENKIHCYESDGSYLPPRVLPSAPGPFAHGVIDEAVLGDTRGLRRGCLKSDAPHHRGRGCHCQRAHRDAVAVPHQHLGSRRCKRGQAALRTVAHGRSKLRRCYEAS